MIHRKHLHVSAVCSRLCNKQKRWQTRFTIYWKSRDSIVHNSLTQQVLMHEIDSAQIARSEKMGFPLLPRASMVCMR